MAKYVGRDLRGTCLVGLEPDGPLFLSRPGNLVPQTIHVVSMLSIVYNEVTRFGIDDVCPMFLIATGKLEIDG